MMDIFNFSLGQNPLDIDLAAETDRQRVIYSMSLGGLKTSPSAVTRVYIAKADEVGPKRLMAVTDQRDIYNMFVEKKIDELDGMFSTMKSRLERTIAALHYVRLELSNGECVGVNPHKFSVSDEPAVEVEKVLYAAVIDNKRGRSTLVKGTPEILQQSFKKAIDAMAQAEERDKKILLIQEMEAERECSEFRRSLRSAPLASNPYLKASEPETHLK